MTRPLYRSGGNVSTSIILQRMTDAQLDQITFYLQQAYANQLLSLGGNHFTIGGSGNAGSATDTQRTQRTGSGNNIPGVQSSDYPGTGTQTNSTINYTFTASNPSGNSLYAPLYWNGSALQRSNQSSLASEVFTQTHNDILTGNELGSYRIAVNSPGTGWVNRGTAFIDRFYNQSVVNTYTLWLKTGGVSAPSDQPDSIIWRNDGTNNHMELAPTNTVSTNVIANYLLPEFTNWANDSNRLVYRVSTSSAGTDKGSFANTHRSGTSNTFSSPDTYISTPVGGATTVTTYFFRVNY